MGNDPLSTLIERLALKADDAVALAGVFGRERVIERLSCLVAEGQEPQALSLLTGGIAQAFRSVRGGVRQTLALFVPGDLIDLQAHALGRASVTVSALTTLRVVQAPRARLEELAVARPAIGRALWQSLARDGAVLQEWLVGAGRRTAYAQIAHLFCELSARMKAAGLSDGARCRFPLTQAEIADVTGLSTVHVNRVLQQLRHEGLIELRQGWLCITEPERLMVAAGFDPAYLGVRGQEIA